ncbi:hypothetical protein [Microtetraspora glauca]|uniref:Uncharacterized protein n=1 Tax=Microtetraspora glauca TaxID=1996 RepID=A0ABV3GB68_MICGL
MPMRPGLTSSVDPLHPRRDRRNQPIPREQQILYLGQTHRRGLRHHRERQSGRRLPDRRHQRPRHPTPPRTPTCSTTTAADLTPGSGAFARLFAGAVSLACDNTGAHTASATDTGTFAYAIAADAVSGNATDASLVGTGVPMDAATRIVRNAPTGIVIGLVASITTNIAINGTAGNVMGIVAKKGRSSTMDTIACIVVNVTENAVTGVTGVTRGLIAPSIAGRITEGTATVTNIPAGAIAGPAGAVAGVSPRTIVRISGRTDTAAAGDAAEGAIEGIIEREHRTSARRAGRFERRHLRPPLGIARSLKRTA